MGPELVFRELPGKLVQRRGQAQWFRRGLCLRRALVNPPGDGVPRVPAAPTGLRLLPPRGLAFRFATGTLAVSCSRVRPEPTAADRTRSLPGLWHGDASWSPCSGADDPQLKSECLGHFWKAEVGKFSRAPKGQRLLDNWGMSKNWKTRLGEEVIEYIRIASHQLWPCPSTDTVNVRNGLLNIVSGELGPHSPHHLSPIQLPVRFDPAANPTAWERFAEQTFPKDGPELAFEIPGWLMVPFTDIQKAVLLTGEGGNGKSVYLGAVMAFLGRRNCTNLSLHRLESDRFAATRLLGKLANICPDLPSEHLAGTSVFKAITGGDPITAEYKFRDSFDFRPFSRLIFSANNMPRSSDSSEGFFRRWHVVPFEQKFEPDKPGYVPREALDAQLSAPHELAGVLNRAISAYHRIRTCGLTESESMRRSREELRAVTDPLAVWLDRFTIDVASAFVPMKRLIAEYNQDCERAGRPPMNQTAFGRALRKLKPKIEEAQRTVDGFEKTRVYVGIAHKAFESGRPE